MVVPCKWNTASDPLLEREPEPQAAGPEVRFLSSMQCCRGVSTKTALLAVRWHGLSRWLMYRGYSLPAGSTPSLQPFATCHNIVFLGNKTVCFI